MKNKQVILVAILFSILFFCIYLLFFTYSIPNTQTLTLYMNQVGLYESKENALNLKTNLEKQNIKAYIFKKDDFYSVVCGVGIKEDKENEETLKLLSYSYINKQIVLEDDKLIQYAYKNEYEKVLELMSDQN